MYWSRPKMGACQMKRLGYVVEQTISHVVFVDDPEFDLWCDKVIEAQEQAKKNLK